MAVDYVFKKILLKIVNYFFIISSLFILEKLFIEYITKKIIKNLIIILVNITLIRNSTNYILGLIFLFILFILNLLVWINIFKFLFL